MYTQGALVNSHPSVGGEEKSQSGSNENGKHVSDVDGQANINKAAAPSGTFEKTSFDQLMSHYNHRHDLPPTLELTQAFLMTQNMKETAARVNGLTAGGSSYFLKNDYIGDTMRLSEAMQSVNRLLGNLGTSDKASNFLLEQRSLLRAQSKENREIRELLNDNIVDGLEYVRVKEHIAETKARVQDLLDEKFTSSEEEDAKSTQPKLQNGSANQKSDKSSETEEDSEEALKHKKLTEIKIKSVITQLRRDAREYLNLHENNPVDSMPLHTIWKKLKRNQRYRRKRDSKALSKGILDTIKLAQDQLKLELSSIQQKTSTIKQTKEELQRTVVQYETATGINKPKQVVDRSVSELDTMPINAKSFEIQNVLFNYCGISLKKHTYQTSHAFGNIKKLPSKSSLLQSYQDQGENKGTLNQNENSITAQARKKNQELIKVIGLEPEKLFSSLDKYKVAVAKMPKFSNVFERAEPIMPGLGMAVASSLIVGNQTGQMSFARVDGRNVISLQFNPYELDDTNKRKVYDQAMKDIIEQRDKIKAISKQAREKQEQSNIKRAWLNIVKKDIPKAFRGYQKYKTDLENNSKKNAQKCQQEVRKKALKTQTLQKQTAMRAKKLTREMMNFWKKRDKEIADQKRKKEKIEKENRRKLEEEKEALLQKKRLEFIMQQSEIYAHFMSKKLGLAEEQQKQRQMDMDDEKKENFARVDIDEEAAKLHVATIINDDRSRVNKFDAETFINKKDKILADIDEDELEIEQFDNPDPSSLSDVIQAPKCFKGALKHYQLKGLRWLDNLYDQGINGILADEMGLGKTIQAIVLLAHLYENKGVWGPFMVVVPVTTLHNWQNELAKFCPNLKVLPYFGSPEERKKLGRFLDPKNLYNPNTQINVLLTSYNLLVNNPKDQAKLMRVKWHYMILDEAQAIKNNMSRRWKVLLQFQARNRLLLTGTPIQNSMAELWALLHFIMPRLFDSHEQFQEWFSKDIEQSSMNQGEISKHQLKRLHLVLKPFMLRRLKKDVESEIGPKVEYEKYCQMTHRQRVLYQRIKNKISTKDLFQLVDSKQKFENLMNLVMQFRKVCNHPELFERRVGRIPFSFRGLQHGMQPNPLLSNQPDVRNQMRNPISYEIPKMVYDECFIHSDNMTKLFTKLRKGLDIVYSEVGLETHMRFFNIFNTLNLHRECFTSNSGFGILRLLAKSNGWSLGELSYLFVADPLMKQVALMHYYYTKQQRRIYSNVHNNPAPIVEININSVGVNKFYKSDLDVNVVDFVKKDRCSLMYRSNIFYSEGERPLIVDPMIIHDRNAYTKYSIELRRDMDVFVYKSQAEPIEFLCRSASFRRFVASTIYSTMHKKVLIGKDFKPRNEINLGRVGRDRSSFLQEDQGSNWRSGPPAGYHLIQRGLLRDIVTEKAASLLELPHYNRLITDCGKMQFLNNLLKDLHKQNHRVLIFCQMTRMLDILEDFLSWRKYTYFRMDGSTSIPDRRYMVEEYQKNPDIFAFLLSTRAGGLGVNLTAADTVVFYDNDWNPTMDAQATDRAHRIGQTKTVSVYRIITKGTVEERIVKRAKQKQSVQSTVYGGNALKADVFKPKDVVEMLLDDQETNSLKERQVKFLKSKRVKRATKGGHDNSHEGPSHKRHEEEKTPTQKEKVPKEPKEEKEKQKPGRKPVEKPPKAPMNIFSTVKAGQGAPLKASAGPFSVFSVSKAQPLFAVSNAAKPTGDAPNPEGDEEIQQEYGEEVYEEEEGDEELEEEDERAQKLLQMLEQEDNSESDDEGGVAFMFDEDENGNKGVPETKEQKKDEEEEDDPMEEY